jgi:hypothetical protein
LLSGDRYAACWRRGRALWTRGVEFLRWRRRLRRRLSVCAGANDLRGGRYWALSGRGALDRDPRGEMVA